MKENKIHTDEILLIENLAISLHNDSDKIKALAKDIAITYGEVGNEMFLR